MSRLRLSSLHFRLRPAFWRSTCSTLLYEWPVLNCQWGFWIFWWKIGAVRERARR